jgi:hypothetical protein
MVQIYGERYRHPKNARFESGVQELHYMDYEEVLKWSEHFMRPLKITERLAAACNAGSKAALEDVEWRRKALAFLGCNSRFFLLTALCGRGDVNHPWLFARCQEVEEDPDGYIDLWSRFHYKSTLITFAGSIQEVIRNPETKIAIFSAVKSIAAAFLSQIKEEFENNEILKFVYQDVLYNNPRVLGADGRPAKWSDARGITVKRNSNPKEATIEAHGLIDSQPTSRHFDLHIYDDMVTQDYLSEEAIRKTTER